MSRVLFLNQPQVGHLNTLLSIALQMRDDGHAVHFLVPGWRGFKTSIQVLETAFKIPETAPTWHRRRSHPSATVIWNGLFLPEVRLCRPSAVNIMSLGIRYTRRILRSSNETDPTSWWSTFLSGGNLAAEIVNIHTLSSITAVCRSAAGILPLAAVFQLARAHDQGIQRRRAFAEDLDRSRNCGGAHARGGGSARPISPWLNLVTSVSAAEAPRQSRTPRCSSALASANGSLLAGFLRPPGLGAKVYVCWEPFSTTSPKCFARFFRPGSPAYQVIETPGLARVAGASSGQRFALQSVPRWIAAQVDLS